MQWTCDCCGKTIFFTSCQGSCEITFSEQEVTYVREREFCVCKDCEKKILKYIKSLGERKSESIVSYIYRKMKEGSNGY